MRTYSALKYTTSFLFIHSVKGFSCGLKSFVKRSSFWPLNLLKMASEHIRPIIAVDIDEVLAQFTPTLAEFHNEQYGGPTLTIDSFVSYEFHRVWGGTVEECNQKMEAFFQSSKFEQGLNPVPHAFEVLQRMKQSYALHVVTARQHKVESLTRSWINRYFPSIFEEIHFGNHYSSDGKSRSKAEICQSIGAKVLIDDSLIYATQCALEGISVILFGQYPWNKEVFNHPSSFHDVSVVVNAHSEKRVVVEEYDPSLSLSQHVDEELSAPHHVYRVYSWEVMEQAVQYLLSKRRERALHPPPPPHSTAALFPPALSTSSLSSKYSFHVVAIQMCSTNDKEENFQTTVRLIDQALGETGGREGGKRVDMVCLPECSAFMGTNALETAQQAETLSSSPYLSRLSLLAKEKGVWLSLGGFPELSPHRNEELGVNKVYNSHIVFNRQGEREERVYRKVHLFDCPLVGLKESNLTAPGSELVVLDIEGWKVGLSICYDLRFSPFFSSLQSLSQGGLDVLLLPAAFTPPTGRAHWEVLLRARAIELQCYVVAAAQAGRHSERRASHGHSLIIDPWGEVLGKCGEEREGLCGAVLEKKRVEEVKKSMPIQEHYRYDVYKQAK